MKYSALFCAITISIIVAGHLSAVEIIKCPEKAPDGFIILKSNQDECVQLKIAVAKQSRTISDTIQDFDGDTSTIIPMNMMDNSRLRDIATMMDQAFGQSDKVIRTKLISMTRNKPYKLILIIKDANFLATEDVLNAGLDVFSKKIFDEDLPKLGALDSRLYASYKEDGLQNLPPELARAVVQRSWYLLPPTLVATLKHKGEIEAVAFSHDGKFILTGSADSTAKLWDTSVRGKDANPLASLKHGGAAVYVVEFSPKYELILTASDDSIARLWNGSVKGEDAKPIATFKHSRAIMSAAFNPDGNTLVTGSLDGKARVWDANAREYNDQPMATLEHGSTIRAIAFAPDGKTFWTIGSGRTSIVVKHWDANVRGNNAGPIETLERSVVGEETGLAFSPDVKSFLTRGSLDKAARLWSTMKDNNAKPLATLKHEHVVSAGGYSRDSKYISTGSDDGTARLWDASVRGNDAKPLTTWKHGDSVEAVAFSTDGKYILTGGSDAKAKLWDLRYAADQLSLPAAQIVLYARKNNLTAEKLPKHLLNELDDLAKTYLPKK